MAQWMQCTPQWSQITPTWADSVCNIDTHDGVDEAEVRKRVRSEEKAFKGARERLRELLERAWDGPQPEPVAALVREIAAPYVERMESGALRIDYEALTKHRRELLAMQDALRTEFEARIAAENDDEDVMLLTALWN